jgi:hypothetical protein
VVVVVVVVVVMMVVVVVVTLLLLLLFPNKPQPLHLHTTPPPLVIQLFHLTSLQLHCHHHNNSRYFSTILKDSINPIPLLVVIHNISIKTPTKAQTNPHSLAIIRVQSL